jgi:signal peptidase II
MQTAGGAAVGPPRNTGDSRRRAVLLAFAVIALDQLTKSLIAANLAIGESRPLIGDLLRLSHIRNEGAAFGMLKGVSGLLALVALVGIVVFAAVVVRRPDPMTSFGAALVAAGASGNLIDRVFREGGVIDFIDLRFWWSFNVADSAITIGAILVLIAGWREAPGKAKAKDKEGPPGEPGELDEASHGP